MRRKRTLVATTDRQVFTSAQSREQQARWLELADTALHNETTTGTRNESRQQSTARASAGKRRSARRAEERGVKTDVHAGVRPQKRVRTYSQCLYSQFLEQSTSCHDARLTLRVLNCSSLCAAVVRYASLARIRCPSSLAQSLQREP